MSIEEEAGPGLLERLEACKLALAGIGVVLRGSVTERVVPCGKQGCRCQGSPPVLHGPYFQWTTKDGGKTKTVRLTAEEAAIYRTWIDNGRRLNKVLAQWEKTGQEAAVEIRRKSRG